MGIDYKLMARIAETTAKGTQVLSRLWCHRHFICATSAVRTSGMDIVELAGRVVATLCLVAGGADADALRINKARRGFLLPQAPFQVAAPGIPGAGSV